jgi:hypothetical protein
MNTRSATLAPGWLGALALAAGALVACDKPEPAPPAATKTESKSAEATNDVASSMTTVHVEGMT